MVKLQDTIKQSKPFSSLAAEAYLNLAVLTQELHNATAAVLKQADLSMPQYNALRILRGAGDDGRTCREIGDRLVHRVPDVTRLLDRLEARGLIRRARSVQDRRVVKVHITEAGLALIAPLDTPLESLHLEGLGQLGEEKLARLIALCDEARDVVSGVPA